VRNRSVIDLDETKGFCVVHPHRLRVGGEQKPEALLAVCECLRCLVLLGDVGDVDDEPTDGRLVGQVACGDLAMAVATVAVPDAKLHPLGAARLSQQLREDAVDVREVVGM
jgi:hypothetical protein